MRFMQISGFGGLLLLYLAFAFPLFYFVYKFGDPEPLAHDYFQYYHLFLGRDVSQVIAPHNMRLAGAFFVHFIYKLNLFYDTACAADKYQSWGFLKQIYFCAIFFNWLCIALTSTLIYKVLFTEIQHRLYAFIGGLIYLLGFGTIFYCMMPLTEAFSILVFTVFLLFYRKKSYWIFAPLCVLIFQREYLLIITATLCLLDYFKEKKLYYFWAFVLSVLAFAVHYGLRKTIFFTAHLDYHSNPSFMLHHFMEPSINILEYLRQLALGLNLFFIYLVVVLVLKKRGVSIDQQAFKVLCILFLEVNLISIAGGHGNNAGRYFYLAIPLVIFALIKEIKKLVELGRNNSSLNGIN